MSGQNRESVSRDASVAGGQSVLVAFDHHPTYEYCLESLVRVRIALFSICYRKERRDSAGRNLDGTKARGVFHQARPCEQRRTLARLPKARGGDAFSSS